MCACAALGEAIEGLDPVRADVYVGVSAGSFVAALLAFSRGPAKLAGKRGGKRDFGSAG